MVYLTALGTYEEIYEPENSPYFFLANGQVAIINYSPTIKTLLSKRAHGLAGDEGSFVDFGERMNILPLSSFPPNTIQLGISLKLTAIQY